MYNRTTQSVNHHQCCGSHLIHKFSHLMNRITNLIDCNCCVCSPPTFPPFPPSDSHVEFPYPLRALIRECVGRVYRTNRSSLTRDTTADARRCLTSRGSGSQTSNQVDGLKTVQGLVASCASYPLLYRGAGLGRSISIHSPRPCSRA